MNTILGITAAAIITAVITLLIMILRRVQDCPRHDLHDVFQKANREQARLDRRKQ